MLPDSDNATDNPCDFSSWFNNSEDADVLLHLSTSAEADRQQQKQQLSLSAAVDEDQQEQQVNVSAAVDEEQQEQQQQQQQQKLSVLTEANAQQQQQHARSFHAHTIILRQRSAYFRSSLTNEWQQANKPCRIGDRETPTSVPTAAGMRYELVEHVEADELDAMEQLLRLMYSQKVPVGTPAELLLQMLRLADRYQAQRCMQLLLTHLAAKGKDAITLSVAGQLFSLPPGVQTRPAFKKLLRVCGEVIVSQYADVPAVIQSHELRQQFCELPHTAVLAWARSDKLQVHSENCIVYLLSAWVKTQKQQQRRMGGQGVSAEQLEQLAHQVRVLQLGPAYQFFVLPHLEWFKGCSGMAHLATLLAYKGSDNKGLAVYPAPTRSIEGRFGSWKWPGPAAWVANARQVSRRGQEQLALSWGLGRAEQERLFDGQAVSSPAIYLNGFQVKAYAERQTSQRQVTLGLFFSVSKTTMSQHTSMSWPDVASVSVCQARFTVKGPTAADAKSSTIERFQVSVSHQPSDSLADWGQLDILQRSAPTMKELVAPLLVDGKLRLEMQVSDIDLRA